MGKHGINEGINLIPMITEKLGVEIEEEFHLDDSGTKYKFTTRHLMYKHNELGWRKAVTAMIWLINGKLKIK